MRRSVIGILAHVDAGKTTLSEALLYTAGVLRSRGRVDHGDSFLDSFEAERARGITIFSKQALLPLEDLEVTLLDTPGHADFSPETERALDALDAAVLVISASEGLQSHSLTLWKLLEKRKLPVFLFINKCDLPNPGREAILESLSSRLGAAFFEPGGDPEAAATAGEVWLDEYLETGTLSTASLREIIARRLAFPCRFGTALKLEGIREFLEDLRLYLPESPAPETPSGLVYKISRAEDRSRLTHLRVTGGSLHPKDSPDFGYGPEKINQIRLYNGSKYSLLEEALPGQVVALTGPEHSRPGAVYGAEKPHPAPELTPVMDYALLLPAGSDMTAAAARLRELEEEEPSLGVSWIPEKQELRVQLMGTVQREILAGILKERFGMEADFGPGSVLYRETVADTVEGVGHYEPLRHYAEVHLALEPAPRGSGLHFASDCPLDEFALNWQRLVLTHLKEKTHLGVLTGAPVTDMKITLLAGKAHLKHTEGGDFREATYRAVRQGLMQAQSVLLEPLYRLEMTLPTSQLGRAMTDLKRMNAESEAPESVGEMTLLKASVPVRCFGDYPLEFTSYTHGLGQLSLSFGGYAPCPEQAALVAAAGYDPRADLANSPDSVFCSHGAAVVVPWDQVPSAMHLPFCLKARREAPESVSVPRGGAALSRALASDAELLAIFERTYGKVSTDRLLALRPASEGAVRPYRGREAFSGTEYTLVDGYNLIFAWDELTKLAADSLEHARDVLIERLRNYQGFTGCILLLIFDAYKVKGNPGTLEKKGDFSLIYTKEAETADMYIEKATYDLAAKHRTRVVSSDALEQMIVLGHGALRCPARLFIQEVLETEARIREVLEEL